MSWSCGDSLDDLIRESGESQKHYMKRKLESVRDFNMNRAYLACTVMEKHGIGPKKAVETADTILHLVGITGPASTEIW